MADELIMATGTRILTTLLLASCVAPAADAGSVTLVWNPNKEPDLAGYKVSYGRAPGSSEAVVDVGNITTWTFATATEGTTYYFRLYAYNDDGLQSPSSVEVSTTVPSSVSTLNATPGTLIYGAVRTGTTITALTPSQSVTVAPGGLSAVAWVASTSAAWLRVSPARASGPGIATVELVPGSIPSAGVYDAAVSITTGSSTKAIAVKLHVYSGGATQAPLGAFDTPADGTRNVSGAIPVTGWAIDDVSVSKVQIFRDPVPGEPGGVYVGDATFVSGARSDIERAYGEWPVHERGGWGLLLLTNALPDVDTGAPTGGNGTFTLRAFAIDAEGHSTALGAKSFTANNRDATVPFGSIDTPPQGGTASGPAYVNFGWVVSPRSDIPTSGSTLSVLVDGLNLGRPSYNNYRSDIATSFPGLTNSNGAVGYFVLDTTKLTNGVHTISWVASDSAGNVAGLGSRYFNVLNGASAALLAASGTSTLPSGAVAGTAVGTSTESVAEAPLENAPVEIARATAADKTPES